MKKGEQTRRHIVIKSAELFNQKGYAGCSMNDIMEATGLQKGGIYRNFKSKDEIAFAAFDYAADTVSQHFSEALHEANTASEKIGAFFKVYEDVINHPPVQGGCPLLNTAVESDDTHPALRDKTLGVFHTFLSMIEGIIEEGRLNGEFKTEINTKALASFVISALEGSIMASKLAGNNQHVAHSREHVLHYLKMI
ncbi:TetR/AcrR family transcriptional regulator [Bacillaceae bacterium SIJ1]|uniref:TetR/AcrR family transcriptional regulator n=1 Tax=Litoribacterium kuwaitense TaxID=1398745 RepID=UPI0013ECA34B|nr:TetR/AcrR family transcriptional regulator [Litoribacterium kuwaitense]NGP46528.1 TetR/AcrR family transcriptional regulator [Litoribacterium kuwaitense]